MNVEKPSQLPSYTQSQLATCRKKAETIYHGLRADNQAHDVIIEIGNRLIELAKTDKNYMAGPTVQGLAGAFGGLSVGGGKANDSGINRFLTHVAGDKKKTTKEVLKSHGNKNMHDILNRPIDQLKLSQCLSLESAKQIGIRLGLTVYDIDSIECDEQFASDQKHEIFTRLLQRNSLKKITLSGFIEEMRK